MKVNSLNFSWVPVDEPATVVISGGKKKLQLRDWQRSASDTLKDATHWVVNAPTGSGKSTLVKCLAHHRLSQSGRLKVVLAVPQTIIAHSFGAQTLMLPDGREIEWFVEDGLYARDRSNQGKKLEKLLRLKPSTVWQNRVTVCSHSTLVTTYKKFKRIFKDVLIIVDEAHHAYLEVNNLGTMVNELAQKDGVEIGLTSGTIFRSILSPENESKFSTYHHYMDEYLERCKHLRSFSYDFYLYRGDYRKAMESLLRKKRKTIVYIPPVNSSLSGGKNADRDLVWKATAGCSKPVVQNGGALCRIKAGSRQVIAVDLVDEALRGLKKDAIRQADADNGRDKLDMIVALNMFREGANWQWAERQIIVGPRFSLTDIAQTIGRLFRDAPGKKHVEVVQLLPMFSGTADKEEFRTNLNDYVKAVYMSIATSEFVEPVYIETGNSKDASRKPGSPRPNFLLNAFGDPEEVRKFLCRIHGAWLQGNEAGVSKAAFDKLVQKELEACSVTEHCDAIVEQAWRRLVSHTLRLKGIDPRQLDLDLVSENPFGFLTHYLNSYTTGQRDCTTLKGIRKMLRANPEWRPFEEAREFVRSFRFKGSKEWKIWSASSERPRDIPSNPNKVYEEWTGLADWIDANHSEPSSFEQARDFARSLNLKSKSEWEIWSKSGKKPAGIPKHPQHVYRRAGWKGYPDWLGNWHRYPHQPEWRSFEDARTFVSNLRLKSLRDYYRYHAKHRPVGIPRQPDRVYSEWISGSNWLGLEERLSFDDARNFVRKLNLESGEAYRTWWRKNRPAYLPISPDTAYEQWTSWYDWIGKAKPTWRTFEKARVFAQKLKLKSQKAWKMWAKSKSRPLDIPPTPESVYKNEGWCGFPDWLGKEWQPFKSWRPFKKARAFVHSLHLKSNVEWLTWCRSKARPKDIPRYPVAAYKNEGWRGIPDWIGI